METWWTSEKERRSQVVLSFSWGPGAPPDHPCHCPLSQTITHWLTRHSSQQPLVFAASYSGSPVEFDDSEPLCPIFEFPRQFSHPALLGSGVSLAGGGIAHSPALLAQALIQGLGQSWRISYEVKLWRSPWYSQELGQRWSHHGGEGTEGS